MFRFPRRAVLLFLATAISGLSGCGYMIGGAHQPDVRTVHVPIFQNETFRRGIEFQLTEAVQREIKQTTPFRLAKEPHADTRLSGRIISFRKDVLGESFTDDPRELQLMLMVEVTWEDLRTGAILAQEQIPIAPDMVQLQTQSAFAPEVGESLATGTDESVEQMARQIVALMEVPW